jgi:hypothetical integral membrane protein (TIGR02206 family)
MVPAAKFRVLGSQHLVVLLALTILVILVVWGARRMRDQAKVRFGWVLGFLLLGYASVLYTQKALDEGLHASSSLPLQLCDWVLLACLITLYRPCALASEMAYFWGLAGTLPAILMPDIAQGFPAWRFIQFFWGHGIALLCIAYIIAAQGFRPRPRSVLRMMLAVNIGGLVDLALDLAFGWNYGYLLKKPSQASLFDYLGPWPWYLVSLEILALVIFWMLALPWRIQDRIRANQRSPRRTSE